MPFSLEINTFTEDENPELTRLTPSDCDSVAEDRELPLLMSDAELQDIEEWRLSQQAWKREINASVF